MVMVNVVDDLRDPEAVGAEHDDGGVFLHLIYEDDAREQAPVEARVEHRQLAAHRVPPFLEPLGPPRLPDDE